ncbi:DNA mismatch repair protein MutS [Neisseria zalophi]|uniref:DNA mismatch repair protein MutS n=2 Tax=Neisseria zalophi TaxID=640030 RepID=A0A5J6PY34_9NEIS|nr:DNA mismatch repair protein MutS [Neisseria zalophi]
MKKYFCMALLFLYACHQHEVKVKALKNVAAYSSKDASYSHVDFVIPKDSLCFLGREQYGKTDRFVEIRCENGLEGLIIEEEAFKPIHH